LTIDCERLDDNSSEMDFPSLVSYNNSFLGGVVGLILDLEPGELRIAL